MNCSIRTEVRAGFRLVVNWPNGKFYTMTIYPLVHCCGFAIGRVEERNKCFIYKTTSNCLWENDIN